MDETAARCSGKRVPDCPIIDALFDMRGFGLSNSLQKARQRAAPAARRMRPGRCIRLRRPAWYPLPMDTKRPKPDHGEPETQPRRDIGVRRATDAPPKYRQASGPKKRPGTVAEKYRGVEYSIVKQGEEGPWAWKLRPRQLGDPVISGTAKGRQNDAIEAAHRAIDKLLGTERK
jgi:hypothetical protein